MPTNSGDVVPIGFAPNGGTFSGSSGGPTQTAAGVTRDQWQHFLDFYRPLEDEVLQKAMQTDFTAEGDVAGRTAAEGVQASRGTLARQLSRRGVSLTGEERAAVNRRQGTNLATSVARAENTTRRGLKESREDLLARVVGIGRGVAQTASAGLQSVADMAAARQRQDIANASATSSANISAGTSLAALAIAFI